MIGIDYYYSLIHAVKTEDNHFYASTGTLLYVGRMIFNRAQARTRENTCPDMQNARHDF